MENRVYNKKIDVSAESIAEFYNRRAKKHSQKIGYTTVLLGDQNPDYAGQWNAFEKQRITPQLKVGSDANVLDIGCGMGRWAEELISKVNCYVGVDFSSEMVRLAKERFSPYPNAYFYNDSFQDVFSDDSVTVRQYDTIIITGVSMYINEDDLRKCYAQLRELLKDGGRLYMEESVGVKERLTLNHIWSENLSDNYDAIYRTREEYLELLNPLTQKCKVIREEYLEELDKKDLKETSHWYIILEK